MVLNIVELVDILAEGKDAAIKQDHRLEVPLRTPAMPLETVRRGYRLMLNCSDQIRDIWTSRKVSRDKVKLYWPQWIKTTSRIVSHDYPGMFGVRMVQETLFDDLRLTPP